MAVLIAIWLLNVLFVAVHEGGHSAVAASFGAQIYSVYVSPSGLEGATTHTQLGDSMQSTVVLMAGSLATVLAIVIAYLLRLEIAVYVLGLRTVESLLNYSTGADMLGLYDSIGSDAYFISIALIIITSLFAVLCFRRRLDARRIAVAAKRSASAVPAPAPAA